QGAAQTRNGQNIHARREEGVRGQRHRQKRAHRHERNVGGDEGSQCKAFRGRGQESLRDGRFLRGQPADLETVSRGSCDGLRFGRYPRPHGGE
ncbi:unnamed protein product, partial [Laminaria digitata]